MQVMLWSFAFNPACLSDVCGPSMLTRTTIPMAAAMKLVQAAFVFKGDVRAVKFEQH